MENELVKWEITDDRHGIIRNIWGSTSAFEDASIHEALVELWRRFFDTVLTWYEPDRWNSILCCCEIDGGKFDIIPTEELDYRGAKGRINLRFDELRARLLFGDFPDDAEFERACRKQEQRFVSALMAAWSYVRDDPAIVRVLENRVIPFRIVNSVEFDVPSLLDVASLGEYLAE